MLTTPPETDTFELSLFGCGVGESAALHMGNGEWVIVDSCKTNKRDEPLPLVYLRGCGIEGTVLGSDQSRLTGSPNRELYVNNSLRSLLDRYALSLSGRKSGRVDQNGIFADRKAACAVQSGAAADKLPLPSRVYSLNHDGSARNRRSGWVGNGTPDASSKCLRRGDLSTHKC